MSHYLRFLDRAKETTTTTGFGTITLAGAVDGFVPISGIGSGNYTYYTIEQGTNFEVGYGRHILDGSTPKLERHQVFASSNSDNSKINLAGVSTVFITAPADKTVIADSGNLVSVTGLSVGDKGLTVRSGITLLPQATHVPITFGDGTKISSTEQIKWKATDGSTWDWVGTGEYVHFTGDGGTTVSYNVGNRRFTIHSAGGEYNYWVASDGSNSGKVPGSGTVNFVGAGTTNVTVTSGLGGAATVTVNDTGVYFAGTGLYLEDRVFHASGATTSNSGIVRLHNAIGPQENLAITPAAVSGAVYNKWIASDGDTTADIFTTDTVQLKGESGIQTTLTSGDPSIFTVSYTGEAYSWTAVGQEGNSGTIESKDVVTLKGVDVDGATSPVGVRAVFNSGSNTFTFSASGSSFDRFYVTPDHQKAGDRIAIENEDYVEVTGTEGVAVTVEAIGGGSGARITIDASGTKVSLTGAGSVTVTESGAISSGNQLYTISGDYGDFDKYNYWTLAGTETGTHTGTDSSNIYSTNTATFVGESGIIAYASGQTVVISAEILSGITRENADDIYTLDTGVLALVEQTGNLNERLTLAEENIGVNANNITSNDSDISDLEAQFGTSTAQMEGTIFEASGRLPTIGIGVAPSTDEAYKLKLYGGGWLDGPDAVLRIGENSVYIDSGSLRLPSDPPASAEVAGSGYLINKGGSLWFNGQQVSPLETGSGRSALALGTGTNRRYFDQYVLTGVNSGNAVPLTFLGTGTDAQLNLDQHDNYSYRISCYDESSTNLNGSVFLARENNAGDGWDVHPVTIQKNAAGQWPEVFDDGGTIKVKTLSAGNRNIVVYIDALFVNRNDVTGFIWGADSTLSRVTTAGGGIIHTYTSGNFGINTSTPSYPLEVNGTGSFAAIQFPDGNVQTIAYTGGAGGGGSTNPAGSDTYVQFNDGGSFGGESEFTYTKAGSGILKIGAIVTNDADAGRIGVVSIGSGAHSTTNNNVVIGANATAGAGGYGEAVSIGRGCHAASWGVAIGAGASATADQPHMPSIAIGYAATSNGKKRALAIGQSASAGQTCVALGSLSDAGDSSHSSTVAIGYNCQSVTNGSTVIGAEIKNYGDYNTVLGYNITVASTVQSGLIVGRGANNHILSGQFNDTAAATNGYLLTSTKFGINRTSKPEAMLEVTNFASTDVGVIVQGAAAQNADLQQWKNSAGTTVASISPNSDPNGGAVLLVSGTIVSSPADINQIGVVSIGSGCYVSGDYNIAIGTNNYLRQSYPGTSNESQYNILIGHGNYITEHEGPGNIYIGREITGGTSPNASDYGVGIGYQNRVGTTSVAIGKSANNQAGAQDSIVAIGGSSNCYATQATAVGTDARSRGVQSTVLGFKAGEGNDLGVGTATSNYSTALGSWAVAGSYGVSIGYKVVAPTSGLVVGGGFNNHILSGQFNDTFDAVNGHLNILGDSLKVSGNGQVRVNDAYTLPTAVTASSGYVLTAYTDGTTAWAQPSGGGGGGSTSPGGSDTYVQFNDGGSFAGESRFTYDKTGSGTLMLNGKLVACPSDVNLIDSLSIGSGTAAKGNYSVVIGPRAQGDAGGSATAVGRQALAGTNSVALGNGANASAANATALGLATTAAAQAVAIGYQATATTTRSVAIGDSTNSTHSYSIGVGYECDSHGDYSVAVGAAASAGSRSVGLGLHADASADYSIAMGNYIVAPQSGFVIGQGAGNSILSGQFNDTAAATNGYLIAGTKFGINRTSKPDAMFDVTAQAAGDVGAIIQGAASQTANFFEVQDSAGAKKLAVDPSGRILMGHNQAHIAPLTINLDAGKLVWATGGGKAGHSSAWFGVGNGATSNNMSLYLTAGTAGNTYINLGNLNDDNVGQIRYKHSDNKLFIKTNTANAVDWDSDQKRYDYAASYGNTESGNIGTATTYLDLNKSNVQYLKLTGNPTMKLEHVHAGQKFMVRLQQDGTGGRSGIWWGGIKWAGGIEQPTQGEGANKASLYGFLCTSSGHYDGFIIGTGIV